VRGQDTCDTSPSPCMRAGGRGLLRSCLSAVSRNKDLRRLLHRRHRRGGVRIRKRRESPTPKSVVGSPKNRGLGQGCRLHGGVGLNTGGGTYIRLGAHLTRIPPTASMGFSRLILSKNPHASILGFPSLFSFCSVFDLNYRGPKRGLLGAPEYVGTGLQYVREYRDDRPTERGTA
jgi:hypothetical protein